MGYGDTISSFGQSLMSIGRAEIQRRDAEEKLASYQLNNRSLLDSDHIIKKAQALGNNLNAGTMKLLMEEYQEIQESHRQTVDLFKSNSIKEGALGNLEHDMLRTERAIGIMADQAYVNRARTEQLEFFEGLIDSVAEEPTSLPLVLDRLSNPREEFPNVVDLPTGTYQISDDAQMKLTVDTVSKQAINATAQSFILNGQAEQGLSYLENISDTLLQFLSPNEFNQIRINLKNVADTARAEVGLAISIQDLHMQNLMNDAVSSRGSAGLSELLNDPTRIEESYPTFAEAFANMTDSKKADLIKKAGESDRVFKALKDYGPNAEYVFAQGDRAIAEARHANDAWKAYNDTFQKNGDLYASLNASLDKLNELPLGFVPVESGNFVVSRFTSDPEFWQALYKDNPSRVMTIAQRTLNTLNRDPRYERSRADTTAYEGQREVINLLARGYSPEQIPGIQDERRNINRENLHTNMEMLNEKLNENGYVEKLVQEKTLNTAAHRFFGHMFGPWQIDVPILPRIDIGSNPEVPPEMIGFIKKLAQSEVRSGKPTDQAIAEAIRLVVDVGQGGWDVNATKGKPFFEKDGIARRLDMNPIAAEGIIYAHMVEVGYWTHDFFGAPDRGPIDVFTRERLTAEVRTRYSPTPEGKDRWELVWAPGHEKEGQSFLSDQSGQPYYITDVEKFRGARSVTDLRRMDPERFKDIVFRENFHDIYEKWKFESDEQPEDESIGTE